MWHSIRNQFFLYTWWCVSKKPLQLNLDYYIRINKKKKQEKSKKIEKNPQLKNQQKKWTSLWFGKAFVISKLKAFETKDTSKINLFFFLVLYKWKWVGVRQISHQFCKSKRSFLFVMNEEFYETSENFIVSKLKCYLSLLNF